MSGTVKNLCACEKLLTGLFKNIKVACLTQVVTLFLQSFLVQYQLLNVL